MSDLSITWNMTNEGDYTLAGSTGFPMLYIGRGSYTSDLDIRSQAVTTNGLNEVHLIYVGRYVSIGDSFKIICNMNHDYRSVYMGVIIDYADDLEDKDYRKRVGQAHGFLREKGMVVIGNDVWIGNNVTVISDVIIGNGAVIGAGSVVTKDIPPYTIWAGNPAVMVGSRFDPDTIRKFQDISWWEFSREKLIDIKEDMQGDPQAFVSKYWNMDMPVADAKDNDPLVYAAFVDIESDYSTFGGIVEKFIGQFDEGEAKLILCYRADSDIESELAKSLTEMLENTPSSQNIVLKGITEEETEEIIASADYFILGRDQKNIVRISYAFKHGTKILSGVNEPMGWN